MPENLSVGFQSLLDTPIISRVRRNHGLEHATLHVLAERHPGLSIAGHSNPGGFWILGDVSTDEVRLAVDEALKRLRGGEGELAVHPNCGTNFVIAGTAAGVCRPLLVALLTWRTDNPNPGWITFSKLDFPAPDGPVNRESFRITLSTNSSTPNPVFAEVYTTV